MWIIRSQCKLFSENIRSSVVPTCINNKIYCASHSCSRFCSCISSEWCIKMSTYRPAYLGGTFHWSRKHTPVLPICTPSVPGYPSIRRSLTRVRENIRTAIPDINDADKCVRISILLTREIITFVHSRRTRSVHCEKSSLALKIIFPWKMFCYANNVCNSHVV